jgi:AcrR family transcriptional regulator
MCYVMMMIGRPRSVDDVTIMAAVKALASELGPQGVTLSRVAKRVGLSAPALMQRFGSKRGLLVAFAKHESSSLSGVFEVARRRAPGALATLTLGLSKLPQATKTRGHMANGLAFLQLDLTDPKLREVAKAHSRALRAELRGLLDLAIQGDELVPAASSASLAADLYATYCGAVVTWAVDGRGTLARWITAHVERVLAPHRAGVGQVRRASARKKATARG